MTGGPLPSRFLLNRDLGFGILARMTGLMLRGSHSTRCFSAAQPAHWPQSHFASHDIGPEG
jgi:hypothetical protein